jgi:hypothetical protein
MSELIGQATVAAPDPESSASTTVGERSVRIGVLWPGPQEFEAPQVASKEYWSEQLGRDVSEFQAFADPLHIFLETADVSQTPVWVLVIGASSEVTTLGGEALSLFLRRFDGLSLLVLLPTHDRAMSALERVGKGSDPAPVLPTARELVEVIDYLAEIYEEEATSQSGWALQRYESESGVLRDAEAWLRSRLDADRGDAKPHATDYASLVAGWVLSDEPISTREQDLLDYHAYAEAIAGLIDDPSTGRPFVMAINAPWGAGKSSLGRMIETELRSKPASEGHAPHPTHWFNAWMHDDAQSMQAALCASVGTFCVSRFPWWRRLLGRVPRRFLPRRDRWLRPATQLGLLVTASIAVGAAAVALELDHLLVEALKGGDELAETIALRFGPTVGGLAFVLGLGLRVYFQWGGKLAGFVAHPRDSATKATLASVRDELQTLIRAATPKGSRLVLFIDDIERCRGTKCVDVLEAVNQIIAAPGSPAAVVLMGDMPSVAAAVEVKYASLAARYDPSGGVPVKPGEPAPRGGYGRLYLQKIVQLQFDLPPVHGERVREMIRRLSSGSLIGDGVDAEDRALTADTSATTTQASDGRAAGKKDAERRERTTHDWTVDLPAWAAVSIILVSFPLGFWAAWAMSLAGRADYEHWLSWVVGVIVFGTLGIIFSGIAIGVLGYAAGRPIAWVQRTRLRRARERAREKLSALGLTGLDAEISRLNTESKGSAPELKVLVEQRRRHVTSSDQPFVRDSLQTALQLAPLLPRNAKRLLNKLRLMLLVSLGRGVLRTGAEGPGDGVDPARLGRWVALHERWPEVAQAIRQDLGLLHRLERHGRKLSPTPAERPPADAKAFWDLIEPIAPQHAGEESLLAALVGEPGLSGCYQSLVWMGTSDGDHIAEAKPEATATAHAG